MSSLNNLFNRVQMLEEGKGKPSAISRVAPVFKNVNKDMTAAGMSASSRDAMLYVTRVLSRLDIISPDVYELTIKGQHKDRMEKIMTILKTKEDEINAKEKEIVEFMNKDLDNFTAGAGADRDRTEKYKEKAKEISQEIQNIKAGKEADDALRDIVKKADDDILDSLQFAGDDDTTIIEIDAGNAANVENVRSAIEGMANELGVEVTGNTVEFSVDAGSQVDQMVKKNGVAGTEAFFAKHFEGEYPVTVSIIPPAGAEEKAKIADTVDALSKKPEGIEGREHLASVSAAADKFLKSRNIEDAEGSVKHEVLAAIEAGAGDEGEFGHKDAGKAHSAQQLAAQYKEDGDDERASIANNLAQYFATQAKFEDAETEDGEYELDDEAREMLMRAEDILGNLEDQGFDDLAANGMDGAEEENPEAEGDLYNLQDQGWTQGSAAWHLSRDIVRHGRKAIPATEDYETIKESKYTTTDSLLDIYADVKPIVETIVESTTVNENGQTSHTQQYIVEKAEAAIEEVYTNQYLTEQKASDSLLVSKEEKSESFKERYQPKTSYQLEELRRYGL